MRSTNNLSDLTSCCGKTSGVLLWVLCACSSVMAVTSVPLEFSPTATTYNLQSQRGVPISSVSNSVTGSDGRLPSGVNESGSLNPATTNQFASLASFGGGLGLNRANWLSVSNSVTLKAGTTAFCSAVVEAMKLPVGRENGDISPIVVVQRLVRIGAPYLCRQSTTLFGSVIPVPETDEFDLSITNRAPSSYWLPQPSSTNGDASLNYYWSPNAGVVYATQPGPITITWMKAAPYTSANRPAYTNLNGTCSFLTNGSSVYLLHTDRYIVSSSAVKTPRKMYWTEGAFAFLGKPVSIDKARVPGGVRIVYNSGFPETVTTPYTAPGEESATNTFSNPLTRLKTFYYDTLDSYLHANNLEGRVFMELLGDAKEDGSRQSLGIELVDVTRQPIPLDGTTELGERLLPLLDKSLDQVTPEPLLQGTGVSFTYRKSVVGSDKTELYATRVTANVNDCLVHWMESGLQGLKWPALFARYTLVWPDDVSKYSHYLRPAVATETQAMESAIALPTVNVPVIAYQDPCDKPRAKLTPEFKFYTFLDASVPAHRALLQFTSGDNVAFERVFSWLDSSLRATNFSGSAISTAVDYSESLAAYSGRLAAYNAYLAASNSYAINYAAYTNYISEYANYPAKYAAYTNYLAFSTSVTRRTRGANTNWGVFVSAIYTGYTGSLESCALVISTTNTTTKLVSSFRFVGGGATNLSTTIQTWSPYPASITVTGITEQVTGVAVELNRIRMRPSVTSILLRGPAGRVSNVFSYYPQDYPPASSTNINIIVYDGATGFPGYLTTNGTYRTPPYQYGLYTLTQPPGFAGTFESSLNALLDPAVAVVDDPGPPPAVVTHPGLPPTVVVCPDQPDESSAPRVVNQTVSVGARIHAPDGELGNDGSWAGHLNVAMGNLYNPGAYIDPLTSGFAAANQGAIIPVNAVPGTNRLEVWWFRANNAGAGNNAGNTQLGFTSIYWPSVLGCYTLAWPTAPAEIVLASNLGSGTLDPLVAQGTIYHQNSKTMPGYNPNEEHALMAGGSAYALRDDLNVTNGTDYSSHPFVLINYTDAQSRPAMKAFRVLREKPESGYVFDYIKTAGQLLQPPMPLAVMARPVEGSGDSAFSRNVEVPRATGDLPGAWSAAYATGVYSNYTKFTWQDRKQETWVYRGPHAGIPALQAGRYVQALNRFIALTNTAVMGQPFSNVVHVSRQPETLALSLVNAPVSGWLKTSGLSVYGTPNTWDVGTNVIQLIVSDSFDGQCVTNTLVLRVARTGTVDAQVPLAITSTNPYTQTVTTFIGRAPLLAFSPTPTNSFTMRYYYKTEASFDWPGQTVPVGTIVPYLRPVLNNAYVGDGASSNCASLEIVYRPVWPEADIPTLQFAQTLADPVSGLPGVRDWKSAQILYQQSVASNITNASASAVLFDPTREKVADLKTSGLEKLPAAVASTYYQGKNYFPNLPPHLATRLFFDPNRGDKGSLVLQGEFKKEIMGESYFLLNVLRGSDLGYATTLCPSNDTDFVKWNQLINALAAKVETHYENPAVPGTYIPDPDLTVSMGVTNIVEVGSANTMVDSYALSASGPGSGFLTLAENSGTANTLPGDPVALHIIRVGGSLYTGELKILPAPNPLSEQVTFQHTADLAGCFDEYEYEWKIGAPVDGMPPVIDATMSRYQALNSGLNLPRYILGGAGVQALGDNYVTLRYRPNNVKHPLYNQWSRWTVPSLAEGWIKRVLAGINPFAQRTSDLFNNAVNTDVSLLTQAGHRWEGDVALNADTLNNYGLIEIYETVLRRGRMLSIEAGYNYGPANDALLLAAGYLNDLYMMVGNEAWADAANPTIGIGTKDTTYGDVATALFAFKGQTASLLEEELALLRGRDDVLQPGVAVSPVYNRLVWNYTRGIDAGEVIYALNYNITENPDETADGIVNAADAAIMFPQGHGDAYGHYLTALKGYYSLISNRYFDWVPRIEAVSILGKAVSVDYQDERKFAAAAVALARAGQQTLALTLRRDFQSVASVGWAHLSATKTNSQTQRMRYWGADHWAARTGQGAYLNWVVGNAMLPDVDPNPLHEGIQKVDRTTVPELAELTTLATDVQTALDNAEGGLNPLGMPEGALALDIDPNVVVGTDNGTHFEQIYGRAKVALNNAVVSFDDAKDITRMMRAEQNSLTDYKAQVANQELSYNNALIELYGTPYPDDIGAGKTFSQGYTGPDLMHYAYVDQPEYKHPTLVNMQTVFRVDTQLFPSDGTWTTTEWSADVDDFDFVNTNSFVEFNIGPNGFISKPDAWTGTRASPGKIQQEISGYSAAYNRLQQALLDAEGAKATLDYSIKMFEANVKTHQYIADLKIDEAAGDQAVASATYAMQMVGMLLEITKENIVATTKVGETAIPQDMIAGLAFGGDVASAARAALKAAGYTATAVCDWQKVINTGVIGSLTFANDTAKRWLDLDKIAPAEWEQELRGRKTELANLLGEVQGQLVKINVCARGLDDAQQSVRAAVAAGDRIQLERQTFRRRAAVVVQGYRTRDAGFRIFRNEKLERYKTLFDLSARYAFLAANAYDYETGLLNTSAGRSFINRIVSARALGVVKNGEPQYAGSNTGDPGLSSALAEMKADWDVLRGRLGFNNPDAYGTIASLRTENLRILPGTDGDANWKDVLQNARMDNILDDADVRRNCMQIDNGSGLAVPGIVLTFSTTITDGLNLFGQELAAGDHAFSPSSFATKIFAVGVALEGYRGMDNPAANSSVGGVSPDDPPVWYLDPLALSATPYIYLIPVGMDVMRSPPLGDVSTIRTWTVNDVAIPMPFNIGTSDFSTKALWQSSDSLTEPLFAVRKHQAFRPVSTTSVFSPSLYGANGTLLRSQFTNNRLVGRSVWNTQWKLVIPGKTLLNDPKAGLDRFTQTVKDAKIYFVTYSYSGN